MIPTAHLATFTAASVVLVLIPGPSVLLALGAVFQLIALLCDGTWARAAGTARTWFAPSRLTGTGGVMTIGLGGTMAVSGHQP